VLVVDDNADTREVYEAILTLEGHFVTAAADAARAVALLENCIFDVAVIDIGLPDTDGYDVARTAHQRLGSRFPYLVAVTGFAGAQNRAESARAGFDVHLVKPVDADSLTLAVKTAFRR
jgi:CheY-like chemotaxis protein